MLGNAQTGDTKRIAESCEAVCSKSGVKEEVCVPPAISPPKKRDCPKYTGGFKAASYNKSAKYNKHASSQIVHAVVLEQFGRDIQTVVAPTFWGHFHASYEDSFWKFPKALAYVYDWMNQFPSVGTTDLAMVSGQPLPVQTHSHLKKCYARSRIFNEKIEMLRALLFTKTPADFRSVLMDYFDKAFKAYHANQKGASRIIQIEQRRVCTGCDQDVHSCRCEKFLAAFHFANQKLLELHLLEYVVADIPIYVAQDHVEKHVSKTCAGNSGSYEVSSHTTLKSLKTWLLETPMKFLSDVYAFPVNSERINKLLLGYRERLLHALYEAYAKVRFDQLFNVIIEFPESQAALEDLRECVSAADLRSKLVSELRETMKKRLLHPGANTADILTAYISSIKALRVLDASGVVLQLVCEPVCKYLRSRDDTVRCIVSSLTDDNCEDLANELMKRSSLVLEDGYQSEEEYENWETWSPRPVDADPNKLGKGQRSSSHTDIISMLVDIYGSEELFVNEYRTLLSDRLLNTFSYNTDKEIRHLELLQLRFGESQLLYCEVMLKDIADSRRINAHLNSGDIPEYSGGDFPVNAMILSAQFWPPFKEEKLMLPEYIWKQLKKYTAAFEAFKGNRTLVWKPHLGQINLEIDLKGRTLALAVSPVHATIIWHFQDKTEWTIDELSNVMQIQASVLRRKITFWQSHGILREEETDRFTLIEEQKDCSHESVVMIEDEMESATASSHDQREEELQTFWSYIVGMLKNMESLPLERIHSMLRMFAMQGPNTNEFTMQGMKQFLDKKVRERELLYSSGLYRLPRFVESPKSFNVSTD